MSNNLDATIKVGLDGSQVEEGVQPIARTLDNLAKLAKKSGKEGSDGIAEIGKSGDATAAKLDTAAKSIDNLSKTAKRAGKDGADGIGEIGKSGDAAATKLDRTTKNMIGSIQRLTAAEEAGAKTGSKFFEALAGQRGVDVNVLRPYLDNLDAIKIKNEAAAAALKAGDGGMKAYGVSAAQTAAALRQLPAQFTDIITSLQGGQKPLTVLLQQGGQIKDSFGGAGNAAKALGGYVLGMVNPVTIAAAALGGLALVMHNGEQEAQAFNKAIILTGNSAGTTADKLQTMAKGIASSSDFTRSAAASALADLAGSGKVASGNLQDFARVALQLEKTVGKSVSETVADLVELGKSPVEASEKLNEKYKYLTGTIYAQIKALKDQGKESEAAKVAQESYINSFDSKTQQIKANLGVIEKAWGGVVVAAKKGWESILNIGREDTLQEKLAAVNKEIEKARKPFDPAFGGNAEARAKLPQNLALKAAYEETIRLSERSAQAAGEESDKRAAIVKWMAAGNQYLTKQQQMEREIAQTRNEGADAGVSQDEINRRIVEVKKKYADLNNAGIAELEAGRKLEKEILAGSLADIEAKHKQELLSNADYINQKRDLQLKDLDAEAKMVKKQASLAGAKADQSQRAALVGELQVISQKRVNIIKNAENEIAQITYDSGKVLKEQITKWNDATKTSAELLSEETVLFGKSAEARKIQSEQIKVDADVRTLLATLEKNHIKLTEEDTLKLEAQTKARKESIASIEGQRQALAVAEQLRAANEQFAIDAEFDDKERARKKLDRDAKLRQEQIRLAGEGTEAQKILQEQYDQWYKNESIKPTLDAQKAMWTSIEGAAHDAFINIFNGGKNAFDRLKDSLKAGLLDLLYQMTVKKWIISIGASVTGSLVSGAANAATAAGAVSNGLSLSSLVGAGANAISAAGTMFGSSAVAAFGGGLAATVGVDTGLAAMYASAATAGNLSAGAAAGGAVGSGLGSIGTTLAAIPGWGWAAMAAAAVAVLGQGKDRQLTGVGLSGQLGTQNITRDVSWTKDGGWFNSNTAGTWKYNLANSSTVVDGRSYTDSASMTSDQALLKTITSQYDAMKVAASDYAKALGLNADYLTTRTQSFSTNLGTTAEEMQKNLADLFKNVGNDISKELLNMSTGLSALAKDGEAASDTLARLAGDVRAADTLFAALGKSLPTGDAATAAAKASLVEMGGGLEKFNQGASYFIQNFLTEAEQMAPVIKSVTDKMSGLGLAGVTTVEQFKNTVKGLDLTTDAGAKLYTSLIEISPAFKTVADYTLKLGEATSTATAQIDNALKSLNDSIQNEIDSLIKSTQTLAQQRAAERVGKDPSTIALLDKRDALQDKIKAEQDAEAKKQELLALTKTRTDLEIGLMEAMGNAEGALAARRKETLEATTDAISKELLLKTFAAQDAAKADQDLKTKADAAKAEAAAIASAAAAAKQEYDRQVAADKQAYDQNISTLRGKLQSAYNAESASLQEVISKHQAYADAAKQAAAALTLGDVSPLNDRQKYSLLQSQLPDIIKQANLSNPDAIGQLQQFAELSKLTNSFDQYTSDLGLVNSTLVNTGSTAQTQATIAKNSLDMMKKEVDVLLGVETGVGTVAEAIAALNLAMSAGLQNVASAAFGQYQANNPSLAKAAVATTTAPTPDQIYGGLAGEGSMQQARAAALKSEADKTAKVQSYMDKMLQADLLAAQNGGVTNQYYMDLNDKYYTQAGFEKFARELGLFADPNLPTLSRLPKFATGGYHPGGLRIVGENGPELEATGPARIYNASQTAALLRSGGANNAELVSELRALAARLEDIEANTRATAGHTNRAANTLDDASDGDALLMRAPA